MFTAYFDATYNHPRPGYDKPIVHTLGGYIGSDENWKKFRKEWREELDKKCLPFFHMTDFEFARSRAIAGKQIPAKSLYAEWSNDDFVPFLQRLHRVINRKDKNGKYRLEARVCDVLKTDFDSTLADELKTDVQCCSYYAFSVVQILKGIAIWADANDYHEPIKYVFAAGDGEDGNLHRLFLDMWSDPIAKTRFRLNIDSSGKPYAIERMRAEPALQAADIAAFEMHKGVLEWIAREYEDVPKEHLRKALASLARTTHAGWLYREKELRESFQEIIDHNKYYRPRIKLKKTFN